MAIKKINHAVLYVTDAKVSAKFYEDVFEMTQVHNLGNGAAIFMRMKNSDNDHDLGLFSIGGSHPEGQVIHRPGLYHLAYEVETLGELVKLKELLLSHKAYVGESDHIVSKSLYGKDPDEIEFEIMWATPKSELEGYAGADTKRLHLEDEIARFGADSLSGQ